MPLLPAASPPGSRAIATPGVDQAKAEWLRNADGMPYRAVYVYNATGGALTAGAIYAVTASGAALTTQNPRLTTIASNAGKRQQFVVALEASANNSWARVCDWGYLDALVDGTVDVAADDNLVAVSGQTYLVKGGAGGGATIAKALEARTDNSAGLTAIFFIGQEMPLVDGAVQYAEVALTNANIKALRATPITLVAAPGAGKTLEFISIVLYLDYGGTNVFTETADNLAVRYVDGSGGIVSETIEMTGFIDQSADTMTIGVAKNDAIVAKTGCENAALVLHNTGDGEIGGNAGNDNLMRAKVSYRVHATGW